MPVLVVAALVAMMVAAAIPIEQLMLIAVKPILPLEPTTMVQTVMQSMVPMMLAGVRNGTVSLGASLRDRAFRSNLRSLRSLQFPLQSLAPPFASLTARSRLPGGSLRSPSLTGRRVRCHVRRHRPPDRRPLLAPALHAALVGDLASLALVGCAGSGHRLGRRCGTPCVAGAGFAGHQPPHCAVQ